jgi:hypothetical protein
MENEFWVGALRAYATYAGRPSRVRDNVVVVICRQGAFVVGKFLNALSAADRSLNNLTLLEGATTS